MSAVTKQEIVEALRSAQNGLSENQIIYDKYSGLAERIEKHGIAPPDGLVLVRKDLVEFLRGAEQFGGVWFGEEHPNHVGHYWWRKFLAAAPEVTP